MGGCLGRKHYYPFGMVMAGISSKAAGSVANKKQYAGNELQNREFSDGSGLEFYDFNARTYDQQTGRFIQIDPLADEGGQDNWTPYHYCANNPILNTDPDGEIFETIWDVANVVMDVGSLVKNVAVGNWAGAAVDGGGLVADVAATLLPGVPGGAGSVIKAARAADKVFDAAKTTKTIGKEAIERGVKNEAKVLKEMNIPKNNKTFSTIDPKTGRVVNVKPDGIGKKVVAEVKDTKKLSNTAQIRGERQVAKQQGKTFKIITGAKTKVSKTIPELEIIRRKNIGPQQ
jgi:RHS repeat-associated protein